MNTKPIRVLVTDDEHAMRRGICTSLSTRGYATGEARSAEEAVMAVQENCVDVVLLDVKMPGMGALRQAGESAPFCPRWGS